MHIANFVLPRCFAMTFISEDGISLGGIIMNNSTYRLYTVELPDVQSGNVLVANGYAIPLADFENQQLPAKRESFGMDLRKNAVANLTAGFFGATGSILANQLYVEAVNNADSIKAFLGF